MLLLFHHDNPIWGRSSIYTIVGELKSDDTPAEQQNIEEMLGVWRKNQTALLGFTCNNESVHLRVLLAEEKQLRLYRLPVY